MKVTKQKFGVLSDGTKVNLYTVKNDNMSFSCTDYGCTLTSIVLNNKDGSKTDVLLGYSTFEGYLNSNYSFGGLVGRFANRIGKASFNLNGKKYDLDKNDGPNCLHSGFTRYEKLMWKGKLIEEESLREQIKGVGIGTSATRAEIIKKLERIRIYKYKYENTNNYAN